MQIRNSYKTPYEGLKITKAISNMNLLIEENEHNNENNENLKEEDTLYKDFFFSGKINENEFENDNEDVYYSPVEETTELGELINDLKEISLKYIEIMKKFNDNFKDGKDLFNPKNKTYLIMDKNKKDLITDLVRWKGTKRVAEALSLSTKSLKRWMIKGTQRKNGGGRKVLDPEMEEKLLKWIEEQKNIGNKLTGTSIKNKAKALSKFKTFLASKGWFEKFKKKNHICLKISNIKK